MAFGIQLGNQSGRSFLGGNGTSLLYWGYVDVHHVHTSTWTSTNAPLFNLPNNLGVTAFIYYDDSAGKLDASYRRGSNGKWQAHIMGRSWSGTVRYYVFVEAAAIPLPQFGIAAYDATGRVKFHSGRPLMAVREINTYAGVYKPAITSTRYKTTYRWNPQTNRGFTRTYLYSAYKNASGVYVAGAHSFEQSSKTAGGYEFDMGASGFAVLDAGLYELYPTLGNYPLA